MEISEYFGAWYKVLPILELQKILPILDRKYNTKSIFPKRQDVFKAFKLCSPKDLKIVILGQDFNYLL